MQRETYTTSIGQRLVGVHPESSECREFGCVIHNPSDHALSHCATHWRDDTRIMERICEHGVGHPDPDEIAWRQRHGLDTQSIHGCDGCCGVDFRTGTDPLSAPEYPFSYDSWTLRDDRWRIQAAIRTGAVKREYDEPLTEDDHRATERTIRIATYRLHDMRGRV